MGPQMSNIDYLIGWKDYTGLPFIHIGGEGRSEFMPYPRSLGQNEYKLSYLEFEFSLSISFSVPLPTFFFFK